MSIDPLKPLLILGPLAMYALIFGMRLLAKRPVVISTARTRGALLVGISGFVIFGPLSFLLPEVAFQRFGAVTWLMLIALYSLACFQFTALGRAGITVWRTTLTEATPIIQEVVKEMDAGATWAGNTAMLPNRKLELHVAGDIDSVSLTAATDDQPPAEWRELESRIDARFSSIPRRRSHLATLLVSFGFFMSLSLLVLAIRFPSQVENGFFDLMRMGRY